MSRAVPRFHRTNPPLPLLTNQSVLEFVYLGSIENQLTLNTFYYSTQVPTVTAVQFAAAVVAADAALRATYRGAITSDWTLTAFKGILLSGGNFAPILTTLLAPQAGLDAAGHEPTTVAAVITRQTASPGQHGRGRLYMPGVPTNKVTASSITTFTNYNSLVAAMGGTITDGVNTWSPCVVSRSKNPPRLATGAAVVTSIATRTVLGTVRRRKLGRGK